MIAAAPDHDVCLMGILVCREVLRTIRQRRLAVIAFDSRTGNISCDFLQRTQSLTEVNISQNKEYHVGGTVISSCKIQGILAGEVPEQVWLSQNVSTQGMVGKNQFFKVVKDQFSRTVFIALDFIDDDFHFLVYFLLGVGAVKYDVRQQFCCA